MRTQHIDDLVARTLCRKHNQALSNLDQALIDLVNSIRESERLRDVRSRLKPLWHAPVHLTVDGPNIERCILKMVMNYAVVLKEYLNDWRPPEWLPSVILGDATKPGTGLAMMAKVGDQIVNAERIRFAFGISNRDGIPFSALLELRQGWRFLCTWERRLTELPGVFELDDRAYRRDDLIVRPQQISFDNGARNLGLSLRFDWSGNWSESKYRNVVALRRRYRAPARKKGR